MPWKQRRSIFARWLRDHLEQSYIVCDIDRIVDSILTQLTTTDLDLSLRSKLCCNRAKDLHNPGLRLKDDTIRLRLEHRHDRSTKSHTLACDALYIQIRHALYQCRLSPKGFVWKALLVDDDPSTASNGGRVDQGRAVRLWPPQQDCPLLTRLPQELLALIFSFLLSPESFIPALAVAAAPPNKECGPSKGPDNVVPMDGIPRKELSRVALPPLALTCSQFRKEASRVLAVERRNAERRIAEAQRRDDIFMEWFEKATSGQRRHYYDSLAERDRVGRRGGLNSFSAEA